MKTRTYLELLKIVKKGVNDGLMINDGLCCVTAALHSGDVITDEEEDKIDCYIIDNRPLRGKLCDTSRIGDAYHWQPGKIAPRLLWLDHHIKKLSK